MLKFSEMYPAIQGESSHAGEPCVILRLTGCNLNCTFCDTPYAREVKEELTIPQVLDFCLKTGLHTVLITGGEPLLQPEVYGLMQRLLAEGFSVLLETNGSLPINGVPEQVIIILDVKCPGSGMEQFMCWENLKHLRPHDEVKFVITDRLDFERALDIVRQYNLTEKVMVLFSPEFSQMKPDILADWILKAHLPIRLNLQIHKYIWGASARGR